MYVKRRRKYSESPDGSTERAHTQNLLVVCRVYCAKVVCATSIEGLIVLKTINSQRFSDFADGRTEHITYRLQHGLQLIMRV